MLSMAEKEISNTFASMRILFETHKAKDAELDGKQAELDGLLQALGSDSVFYARKRVQKLLRTEKEHGAILNQLQKLVHKMSSTT